MLWSPLTFRIRVSHQTQEPPFEFLPAIAGDATGRLVAHKVTLDLDLLPPVGERVGLIMLASGTSTRVISPGAVLPDAIALIEELLHHHEMAD